MARYQGRSRNGKKHGRGIYTWADGSRFEGDWVNDKRNGRGIRTYASGKRYEGQYLNGKRHGQGIYTWPDGARYEGDFLDGKRTGRAIFTYASGERYDGQYHEGVMHGRGVFTSAQGRWTYSGALDQQRPTEGELVEADGRRFNVTYLKDCALITHNPKAKTKVGVVCGAVVQLEREQQQQRQRDEVERQRQQERQRQRDQQRQQELQEREQQQQRQREEQLRQRAQQQRQREEQLEREQQQQRQREELERQQRQQELERQQRQQEERQREELERQQRQRQREELERQQRQQELERQQRQREELERQQRQHREQQQQHQREEEERQQREQERQGCLREQEVQDLLGRGSPCEISVDLVVTITDNFRDEKKLGEGAFGDVYEGVIADTENQRQVRVAVKRLKPSIRLQGDETEHRAALTSIRREIHVLGRFYHPNIIRLLGFTSTSAGTAQELCLVYELGQHGSLDKMLVDSERAQDLSCKVRVRIAAGVSRALNYLHCHDPRGPAFHRDVKSANIVLDLGLNPKLIDCGLSKFVPEQIREGTSTRGAALGTRGYMCPTYQRRSKYDAKSEIFSFGMVLLELLTGRIQFHQNLDENDLYAVYIEDRDPVTGLPPRILSGLDTRAGTWLITCAETMESLARECLSPYGQRIGTMLTVMRRLVDLEKRFCLATDEETRMLRLAEELQRERDALRLQVSRQEAVRAEANRTCIVCFDDKSAGLDCETSRSHFICAECAPQEVQRILQEILEPVQLARHREQGGRIKCVHPDCEAAYPEPALARVLSDDLFGQYRAAQDAVVEQRLFDDLQARFQRDLAAVRAELERGNGLARTQQDAEATAEFMRRQYPNAVQCPHCSAGPVIPEGCSDLQAHHGERRGSGQISNACPACRFFSRRSGDWVRWNGQMR